MDAILVLQFCPFACINMVLCEKCGKIAKLFADFFHCLGARRRIEPNRTTAPSQNSDEVTPNGGFKCRLGIDNLLELTMFSPRKSDGVVLVSPAICKQVTCYHQNHLLFRDTVYVDLHIGIMYDCGVAI